MQYGEGYFVPTIVQRISLVQELGWYIYTQYKKNCHFDLMFVTSQLKGIVVLNTSMNVCY